MLTEKINEKSWASEKPIDYILAGFLAEERSRSFSGKSRSLDACELKKSLSGFYRDVQNGSYSRDDPSTPPEPIYVSKEEMNELVPGSSGQVLGFYDQNTNQIYILNSLSREKSQEVRAHELLHWQDPSAPEWLIIDRTMKLGYT